MINNLLNWFRRILPARELPPCDYSTIDSTRIPPKELHPFEQKKPETAKPFLLYVDDNYHYMDEDSRYTAGEFDTWAEAVAYAKKIVDETVIPAINDGLTPEEAYKQYRRFGEDPWIGGKSEPTDADESFSAWAYAEERCYELYAEREENPDE